MILIGIDPGTKTGIAVWDSEAQRFQSLYTLHLNQALFYVYNLFHSQRIKVFIEDPTTWRPFKNTSRTVSNARIQGAGSIKRDFAIWKEFCEDFKIPMTRTKLQGTIKKVSQDYFERLTGYTGQTSQHSRDAAMLVFGMKHGKINLPETVSM